MHYLPTGAIAKDGVTCGGDICLTYTFHNTVITMYFWEMKNSRINKNKLVEK